MPRSRFRCVGAVLIGSLLALTTQAGAAPPPPQKPTLTEVFNLYCGAEGHNDFWCNPRPNPFPEAQMWEVLEGYCFDHPGDPKRFASAATPLPGSVEICDMLLRVPDPLKLTYDAVTQVWNGKRVLERGSRRGEVDFDDATGKPTVYLKNGERLGVVIDRINSLSYTATRGQATEKDIEGLAAVQTLLTAAGGNLSAIVSTVSTVVPDKAVSDAKSSLKGIIDSRSLVNDPAAADAALEAFSRLERREFVAADRAMRRLMADPNVPEPAKAPLRPRVKPIEVAAAFEGDLADLKQLADDLKARLDRLTHRVARLDLQQHRLQALGRQLNTNITRTNRPFDPPVTDPAEWSKLFENLRIASALADGKITECKSLLESYVAFAVGKNSTAEVYASTTDYLKEVREPGGPHPQLGQPCGLTRLQRYLTDNVTETMRAARTEATAGSSKPASEAGSVARLQIEGMDLLLQPARALLRNVNALAKVQEDIGKIFEKEDTVKKQGELSRILVDRANRASHRLEGTAVTFLRCGSPALTTATGMSIRLDTPPAEATQKVLTMVTESNAKVKVTVPVPAGTDEGELIPIGVPDVDAYIGFEGCADEGVTVIAHRRQVLSNRLFVQEREFRGKLTKVRTEKVTVARAQPDGQELLLDGPSQLDLEYDVARRSGQVFGASVGLIYTPVSSKTYVLTDPTPDSETTVTTSTKDGDTTTETKVAEQRLVSQQASESRAGIPAAFLNVRALQLLVPQTRSFPLKPGVEIGFAITTSKPAFLLGGSLEISRFLRIGGGRSWVQATDLRDPTLVGKLVPGTTTFDMETRMRPSWYASITFALDSLNLFSGSSQ